MTTTMQAVLMMAMIGGAIGGAIGGSAASAQQLASGAIPAAPGVELQLNVTAGIHAQVKDDLFAGAGKFAQGASEVTEINLDPSTMGMIGRGPFVDKGRDGGLASKMNFMVIRSYRYDKPGMYSMDDFDAYSKKLTDGTWNCSIHVRGKEESTDICSRTAADHESNEMVILTAQPRELTFIHLSGKMSLNDLARMSGDSRGIKLPQEPMSWPEPKAIIVNPRLVTPVAPASPSAPPAPPVTSH
jgi:hypothetical protein